MHTWSENPKKDMFHQLEMLTYSENCKQLLNGKINSNRKFIVSDSKLLTKKSSEMSFCIKQGIEFFKNAEDADISISPLLLYYGILSFSKGLVIANSNTISSLDEIKYHGLTTRPKNNNQNKQKSKKDTWRLIDEYANVNNGVFLELAKIFNVNLEKDSILKLKDTLACIPELMNILNKFNYIESDIISCYSEIQLNADNTISFGIYKEDELKLEKNIKCLKTQYEKSNMHSSESIIQYKTKKKCSLEQFNILYNYSSSQGGRYFVPEIQYEKNNQKRKVLLPQVLLDYINFFILSEQVRYHQDNWYKILKGQNKAIISILKMYIEITKRRFPNFVLDELFNETFSYGSPAYLN